MLAVACQTEGCTKPIQYRNLRLCNTCYHRLRKWGTTTKVGVPGETKHPRAHWGHNLDRLRRATGLGLKDFCHKVGTNHNTYAQALRPDSNVGLQFYLNAAQFLGVELSDLFQRETLDAPESEQPTTAETGPGEPGAGLPG